MQLLRSKLTYANVVSTLCLFLLVGGGAAVAAGLSKNSVGPKQLKANSVTTAKLKNDAVTGAKVKAHSLAADDLAAGVIPAPVNAYTKTESDARYLRGTITVVKTIAASIAPNSFASGGVTCPAGHQAVGGGVDPDGIFFGKISQSSPAIDGVAADELSDGQHGPMNGWVGTVTTEGAGTGTSEVKIMVICAPIG